MVTTARRLLVSIPTLHDPNFFRSVVFMIEHNADGAVGLVLNQPTDALLTEALPDWAGLAAPPAVAFVGGPVQQHEAVIGLARVARAGESDAGESDGWQPLLGRVGTVDLARAPSDVSGDLEAVRVFAGYSGWGPRSSMVNWRRAAGSPSTRCPTTCSRRTPRDSGGACFVVSAVTLPHRPTIRWAGRVRR